MLPASLQASLIFCECVLKKVTLTQRGRPPFGPLTLAVNTGPCWETFQNWNSKVQRDVPARGSRVHASSLKGNSVTGHVFTRELNYLLWRRLLHLLSVKLLNTGNEKHPIKYFNRRSRLPRCFLFCVLFRDKKGFSFIKSKKTRFFYILFYSS